MHNFAFSLLNLSMHFWELTTIKLIEILLLCINICHCFDSSPQSCPWAGLTHGLVRWVGSGRVGSSFFNFSWVRLGWVEC